MVINLIEQRDHERSIGYEYVKLFNLFIRTVKQTSNSQQSLVNHLQERDFIWFDYHEQSRTIRNMSAEQFVQKLFIENPQYSIKDKLQQNGLLTCLDGIKCASQKGVFRINCIDCLDRTNNVQLTIGSNVLLMQFKSLSITCNSYNMLDRLREMWVNNGDNISRIYTGTGALGQRSKVRKVVFIYRECITTHHDS